MSLNLPMAYLYGHFILKIVGILSLVIPGPAARKFGDILAKNPPPYKAPPLEHSEEYNEEEYEIPDYTPIFESEDTFDNGPEDDININTITTLSLSPLVAFLTQMPIVTSSMTSLGLKEPVPY